MIVRMLQYLVYVLRVREDSLTWLYDRFTEQMLREDGYIELRRRPDWYPGDWR